MSFKFFFPSRDTAMEEWVSRPETEESVDRTGPGGKKINLLLNTLNVDLLTMSHIRGEVK